MEASTFAMTPASGFTPSSGNPWYDPTHLASHRAIAVYDNSAGSQNELLGYGWNDWNSNSYTATNLNEYTYSYDPNTWLKTGASFYKSNGTLDHSESYGYDPNLDYLTSAQNQGGNGATETWSYDAAGNRASDSANPGTWTYDNLNRMTASPGLSYSNSATGNRLTTVNNVGTANYGWDVLNRMTSFTPAGGTTTTYGYRADGMRIGKLQAGPHGTSYAYDGQMGIQDVDRTESDAVVTDYGIGGRGIDWMQTSSLAGTQVKYPVYDGHGNMVATLTKSGTGCSIGDPRAYDAWGNILSGAGSGDPKGRYCANLGHKQDDESGLTYMRARYYEATSGRFVSEDPSCAGRNWFSYASNSPISRVDQSGRDSDVDFGRNLLLALLGLIGVVVALAFISIGAKVIVLACLTGLALSYCNSPGDALSRTIQDALIGLALGVVGTLLAVVSDLVSAGWAEVFGILTAAVGCWALVLGAEVYSDSLSDGGGGD